MISARWVPVLALGALLGAGCASKRAIPYHYEADEVPSILTQARAELAGEVPPAKADPVDLVDRLRSARAVSDLPAGVRQDVQNVLEEAAARLIDGSEDPKPLEDLVEYDLPRRLSVEAGIRAARLHYRDGERMRAFRTVRTVDGKFPQHHQRMEAGRLLAEVGLDLAADHGRYGIFFRYRSLAIQVLEYFVQEYPNDPAGPRALRALAEIYEDRRRYGLAIAKNQDLLLWFPEDPLVAEAEADIPRLRLAALGSPEHDRKQMQLAREELDAWLADHPGHALVETVEPLRLDALRRLADNDLVVARFYRTVKNLTGAEYHARRALEEARDGRDEDQIAEAEGLLADVARRLEAERALEEARRAEVPDSSGTETEREREGEDAGFGTDRGDGDPPWSGEPR